uniref:Uncharacterized protein n=1 Tax=viral metagenome TaxID=1070528 RepID=A0A6M3KTY8_9ZZZZ
MNELNYGSREACQRLFDEGIVVETDMVYVMGAEKVHILVTPLQANMYQANMYYPSSKPIPAPSMAEVWRGLPPNTMIRKFGSVARVWITNKEEPIRYSTNPTDALIDLLIWLEERKEAKHEKV